MLVMGHDIEPQGEELLRGEVLSIAAASITRMEWCKGRVHIPTLVFYLMGNSQRRII